MSDSALQPALNQVSSRENYSGREPGSRRDWKVLVGQIAAVLAVLLGVVLYVLFSDEFMPVAPECLVVDAGWEVVGHDPDTGAFFCLQSETGVYRLDCPVSVVECP